MLQQTSEGETGKTNQARNDILHVRVRSATALTAKIIEPRNAVHKEVYNGDNNGDSDGVTPDHNGSDDAGAAVRFEMSPIARVTTVARAGEPTKDTEEGGQNIDAEDGSHSVDRINVSNLKGGFSMQGVHAQLPRGPGFSTSSNKYQPIFRERDLQEKELLDVGEVLDETSVGKE